MKGYIICFVLTIIFARLAEISFRKKNFKVGVLFSIFVILVPTYIAGMRAFGVGRDMQHYVLPMIHRVDNAASFIEYYKGASHMEVGYRIFIYITASINNSLEFTLFCLQLVPCTCVYIFAYKNREKLSITLVMTTYLLTWYCRSYTIMRQSLAIGFIILGVMMFREKKYIKCLILSLIAISFHNSGVFGLFIYVIIYLIENPKYSSKKKVGLVLLILAILAITVLNFTYIVKLAYSAGIINDKFYSYVITDFYKDEITILSFSEVLMRMVVLALATLGFINNSKTKKLKDYSLFYSLLLIELVIFIISFRLANGERISYYYLYLGMLYCLPALSNFVKQDRFNKTVVSIFVVGVIAAFWYWKYPLKKNCETYPYRSDVAGYLN